MSKPEEQRKSKLKFFAAYLVSVFLILVVFAALWQGDSAASSRPASFPATMSGENYMEADAFLHNRMEELDGLYMSAIGNNGAAINNLREAEKGFIASLDSLEDKAEEEENKAHKDEWQLLVSNFRTALQARGSMMNKLARMQQVTTPVSPVVKEAKPDNSAINAVVEDLKSQLAKKDEQLASLESQTRNDIAQKNRTIASLQEQVRKGTIVVPRQNNSAAEEEWKKKYNAIRSRHTELNTAYNALSASFQSVVADNRRLLGQLQQLRKQ